MSDVEIYTDGACSGNPGPGGWGAVLIYRTTTKEIYGSVEYTTNNRMELTAPIEALKLLKKRCEVNLYTDSNYLREGITKWIHNWKQNNWRTSNKAPIKNIELWQSLEYETLKHNVTWHWIRAHSGNKWNDVADQLAVKGRNEAQLLLNK
ncbi:Ribonuclease HI [Rickettsiales bacterium Ac37b]|nr:Ribonuclease HI [Rickettsiales bacterium Ac37b]